MLTLQTSGALLPNVAAAANLVSTSVAENVSSFLSGICATFRQDNVIVIVYVAFATLSKL